MDNFIEIQTVPNSSEESGNTQITDSSPNKPQIPARKHHFMTFNGYDSSDIQMILKVANEHCYMYVFQEEMGKTGNRHLQGVFSLKKKERDTIFNIKQIHWEKVINLTKAYLYCSDPKKRHGQIWVLNYTPPPNMKLNLYPWELVITRMIMTTPDDRGVNWIWSSEGNQGKSVFCKFLVINFNAVFLSKGKYSDIINILFKTDMNNKNCVIFDLPRNNGNKISYDAVESIKNGMVCNTKFETGYKMFEPPHIFVFANQPPQKEKLSEDRWNILCIDGMK